MAHSSGSSSGDASLHDLRSLLEDVQLVQFLPRLRDDLQVTQLSHFDYVKIEDLERIGLGKPAARRIINAVKKKRNVSWRKAVVAKLLHGVSSSSSSSSSSATNTKEDFSSLEEISGGHTSLIQEKDIAIGKRLGDGSFGVVREGEWTTSDGTVRKVAVKVLKVDVVAVAGALEDFMREVTAMTQLSHPNLIRLYGIVLGRPLMMVTELAPLGSLQDILRSSSPPTIIASSTYILQVCSAMRYLESRRCIHRDLAARNIFLATEDTAKLGDFGLSRSLSQSDDCYIMTEPKKVPFPWCAPESLKTKTFSHASDMWMFGVTIWEVYSREEPWPGLNGGQILRNIEAGERLSKPIACPAVIYQLLESTWKIDPSSRPTFSSAYEFLVGKVPEVVVARQMSNTDGKLNVQIGDKIAIIDGEAELYWWIGENMRTGKIGEFPRCVVESDRPLRGDDISSPVHNSFIHTGHGGVEKSWGNPSFIDEMFLQNPMSPHDNGENGIKARNKLVASSGATLPRKRMSPRAVKHQSLRMKANKTNSNSKSFSYRKLDPNKWPNDIKAHEHLVDLNDSSMSRNKSYSASDLRCSLPPTQTLTTICDEATSNMGSVSSLTDLPIVGANSSGSRETPRLVPVRPSPAPPVGKMRREQSAPNQSDPIYRNLPLPATEDDSNLVYGNLPGAAPAVYDEPPADDGYGQPVYGNVPDGDDIVITSYYQEDDTSTFNAASANYLQNESDVASYPSNTSAEQTFNEVSSNVPLSSESGSPANNATNTIDDEFLCSSNDPDIESLQRTQRELDAVLSNLATSYPVTDDAASSVDRTTDILSSMWMEKVASNQSKSPHRSPQKHLNSLKRKVLLADERPLSTYDNVNSYNGISSNATNVMLVDRDEEQGATSSAEAPMPTDDQLSAISPKFLNRLEKSLGREHAAANTLGAQHSSEKLSDPSISSAFTHMRDNITTSQQHRMSHELSRLGGIVLRNNTSLTNTERNNTNEIFRRHTMHPLHSEVPSNVTQATIDFQNKLNIGSGGGSPVNHHTQATSIQGSAVSASSTGSTQGPRTTNIASKYDPIRRENIALNLSEERDDANSVPSSSGSVFSDFDVGSSSKTLGLNSKPDIDMRKYFTKNTAHVRPMVQKQPPPPVNPGGTYPNGPNHPSLISYTSAPHPLSAHYPASSNFLPSANYPAPANHSASPNLGSSNHMSYSTSNMAPSVNLTASIITSFPRHTPSPLTAQELEQFAAPPSAATPLPVQQEPPTNLPAAGVPPQLIEQIQQQHMQQYGNPLSEQQLRVRLVQHQHQHILLREQQQLQLQQQNLQQIQQLRQQQMIEPSHQHQRQQPAVLLSPRVTVNYNQVVCSNPPPVSTPPSASAEGPDALLARLVTLVPGVTIADAKQAMTVSKGNFQGAMQFLKIEKLYRLGVTDKANCEAVLQENNWELQRSASILLDKFVTQ